MSATNWKSRGSIGKVRGVPLQDIAAHLERVGAKVEFEKDGLGFPGNFGPTEIRVLSPAEPSLDAMPLKAVVVVRTRLPDEYPIEDALLVASNNRFAALGAITSLEGKPWVVSRLTTYQGEDAWRYHVPLLACSALYSADGLFRREAGKPGAGGRKGPGWPAADFMALELRHRQHCYCTADKIGFTAEFGLRAGPGASALGDDSTALLNMNCRHPHPFFGPGLHVQLYMPHQFSQPERLAAVVMKLNAWEAQAGDRVPHYGAWCAGEVNNPTYTCFLPRGLWDEGLVSSLATWMRMRALLADGFLLACGCRAETVV